jgi:acyl-CoA synthetase (AMP-forming)/AMP-acid ligase II
VDLSLILSMAAEAAPDRLGVTCGGRSFTYGELWEAANRAAALFAKAQCANVALIAANSEANLIALFGAARAGIPYCPLNYRLADAPLSALLARLERAVVIGDSERFRGLATGSGHSYLDAADLRPSPGDAAVAEDGVEVDPDGVAVQLFTSGTTAAPKAALLRHGNLMSYILGTVEFGSAEPEEATLVSVPPYHIAGIAALLSSVYALRRIVLMPTFEAGAWVASGAEERVTQAFIVPTMLARILQELPGGVQGSHLSSLRSIAYGGGRMPIELIAKAVEAFPQADFTNAYGLTETSSTIALLGPEDHRAAFASEDPAVKARLGSVGRPLPTVELEVRSEDGRLCPPGEVGEIYVRGDQVSGQYGERDALIGEGWFPTRDTGYVDAEGYLFLLGRADDVIVRGGENISPSEIEDVLLSHAGVADAAAVGIPSVEWGEEIAVAIVPLGEEPPLHSELTELIRSRLRSSRLPARIEMVASLPYNEMGKLLRREVRRSLVETAASNGPVGGT